MKYSARTAAYFAEATQRWENPKDNIQTAFNLAHGTDLPYFAYFAQSEAMSNEYAQYMRSQNKFEGSSLKHVLDGFDWASLGKAHVVDVSFSL